VSDTAQGPGWWQASDGRWYGPDEISADAEPWAAGPSGPVPGYGVGPGYGVPGYGYSYGAPVKTNGLAIASLVCSLFFWLYGLPAVLAVIFGFVARGQIRRSHGTQAGNGMALAGIVIGFAGLAVGVLLVVLLRGYVLRHCNNQLSHCDFTTGGN